MTRQTFVGLECELRRRGYAVETNSVNHWINKTKPRWRFGLDRVDELEVRMEHGGRQQSSAATIRFYGMYRPMEDLHEVKQIARDNDVLVFDHGLHYGAQTPAEWRQHMTEMIQQTREQQDSSLKLLLWRETSSQHFNTTGGHFYPTNVKESKCVPPPSLEHNSTVYNFRRQTTEQLIQELNATTHLKILPFYHYTKLFYDLHMNKNFNDCTHFCSTPALWLYLWRTLRLALEEIEGG